MERFETICIWTLLFGILLKGAVGVLDQILGCRDPRNMFGRAAMHWVDHSIASERRRIRRLRDP